MCGIFGFLESGEVREPLITAMSRGLRHRGPDAEGIRRIDTGRFRGILGHRRLSILDIAGGVQPLVLRDRALGAWTISYNGEVYNYAELKATLEKQGVAFGTESDTEVVLAVLASQGPAALATLNGMFAFAALDPNSKTLFLARDPAGIKPLYYATLGATQGQSAGNSGIVFASELTTLLLHPLIKREVDRDRLREFFFTDSIAAPGSAIAGVRKLQPGSYIRWRDGRLEEPVRFAWPLGSDPRQAIPEREHRALADYENEFRDELRAAVRRHLIADVPVGVFLSGGIDSSSVAAMAQAIKQEDGRKETLRTFSIAFEEKDFDESPYARLVAQHLGTDHIEKRVGVHTLVESVDALLTSLDEPLGDSSILPTAVVSQLAAKHVKVVLGGDGGDELWGGYPTYRAHALAPLYRRFPNWVRKAWIGPMVRSLPVRSTYQSLEWKLKRFAERFDHDPIRRHFRWMSASDTGDVAMMFRSDKPTDQDWSGHEALREFQEYFGNGSRSSQDVMNMMDIDFMSYLPGSVLTKVDRASMAYSLEVRPPMLDREFVRWSRSVPLNLKIRRGVGKYLMKQAMRPLLPAGIVDRKKRGFAIPLARWCEGVLGDRVHKILADSPVWEVAGLERSWFASALGQHRGRARDRSRSLWSLIVLDHWCRRVF